MRTKIKNKVTAKMVLESLLGTVIVIGLLGVLNAWIFPMLTSMFGSTAFLGTVNLLFTIAFFFGGLFVYAKYVSTTRKLNAIELIYLALLTMLFASIITIFVPSLVLAYELTIPGIAMFFSAIFMGISISKELLKNIKL